MGFNIGSQQAGIINNVEGGQQIAGGQVNVAAFDAAAARDLLTDLRRGLDGVALDGPTRQEAGRELDGLDQELARPEPDPPAVAGALERLTRLLASTGALAAAAGVLSPPLGALAGLLGALGQPIVRLLTRG